MGEVDDDSRLVGGEQAEAVAADEAGAAPGRRLDLTGTAAEDSIIVRRTLSPLCSMRASVATGYSFCGRGSAFGCAQAKPEATRHSAASAHRSRDRHGASRRLGSARRMRGNSSKNPVCRSLRGFNHNGAENLTARYHFSPGA
jgi:hypothetical protein